jgi:hypothetical protein
MYVYHAHRERRTHPRELEHDQRNQCPIPEPNGRGDIDAIEQLPCLRCIEHGSIALAGPVTRPAPGRCRIMRHDLADQEPVEEISDGGQVLFDGRRGQRLRLQLDLGSDMQRLNSNDRHDARLCAPSHKTSARVRIRAPGVRVEDFRCEKFQTADAGALTRDSHNGW